MFLLSASWKSRLPSLHKQGKRDKVNGIEKEGTREWESVTERAHKKKKAAADEFSFSAFKSRFVIKTTADRKMSTRKKIRKSGELL